MCRVKLASTSEKTARAPRAGTRHLAATTNHAARRGECGNRVPASFFSLLQKNGTEYMYYHALSVLLYMIHRLVILRFTITRVETERVRHAARPRSTTRLSTQYDRVILWVHCCTCSAHCADTSLKQRARHVAGTRGAARSFTSTAGSLSTGSFCRPPNLQAGDIRMSGLRVPRQWQRTRAHPPTTKIIGVV